MHQAVLIYFSHFSRVFLFYALDVELERFRADVPIHTLRLALIFNL